MQINIPGAFGVAKPGFSDPADVRYCTYMNLSFGKRAWIVTQKLYSSMIVLRAQFLSHKSTIV